MLRQRGQTSAEYVGLILVVAAVIALVATSSIGEAVTTKVTCTIQGMGGGAGCGGAETGAAPQEGTPPAEPSAAPLEAEAPAEPPPEEEEDGDDGGGIGGFFSDAWDGTTDAVGGLGTGAWNGTKALGGELWTRPRGSVATSTSSTPRTRGSSGRRPGAPRNTQSPTRGSRPRPSPAPSWIPSRRPTSTGGSRRRSAAGRSTPSVRSSGARASPSWASSTDSTTPSPMPRGPVTPRPTGTPRPTPAETAQTSTARTPSPPRTPVLLADGTKRAIAALAVGDRVLASDPGTGATGARAIERVIVGEGRKVLVRVRVSGEVLTATDHHPVWVEGRGTFVDAEDLRPGERLRRPDGSFTRVEDVRILPPEEERVYNLTVTGHLLRRRGTGAGAQRSLPPGRHRGVRHQ